MCELPQDRLALSVDETAKRWGCRPRRWRIGGRGLIRSTKIGGRRLYPVEYLKHWLAARTATHDEGGADHD